MATRQETQQRKMSLRRRLADDCRSGALAPGQVLPPLRLLAKEHGLSVTLAAHVVQELVGEGVLHTRSTAGTFVGAPQNDSLECFLLMVPYSVPPGGFLHQLQIGFEARVAELGGASLVLLKDDAWKHHESGDLPPLAGVFDFRPAAWPAGFGARSEVLASPASWNVPFVSFDDRPEGFDSIRFDDFDGGRQAARHLLRLGHRRIAYLGLHENENDPFWRWSFEREHGWRAALEEAGCDARNLAYHPRQAPKGTDLDQQIAAARQAAHALVRRGDISAVIVASEPGMRGLFDALREAAIPPAKWPALLHFDDVTNADEHVISIVRLPWDDLGRTAAEILSARRSGRSQSDFQTHLVPMRLIPRLTCRSDWAQTSRLATRRVREASLAAPAIR